MTAAVEVPSRVVALRLINRCMPAFAAGMHAADDQILAHELFRLEALPSSPVNTRMIHIVEDEIRDRQAGKR
jgi:hypothetical protein